MAETRVPPMHALYLASVLNGAAAPILLGLVMLVATDRRVMGRRPLGRTLTLLGWTSAGVALLAVVLFAYANAGPR